MRTIYQTGIKENQVSIVRNKTSQKLNADELSMQSLKAIQNAATVVV